ncbi:tRNA (cytidine(34)-2'-O)-methyltransferase [Mycoplasmopsis agassizii]|uniref:tRNA (cytidine(34)-2'-O)-methyltransferase n=1 Tax=Mycoplasmopsis agassizii TaxID=33922 RepID=UPI00352902E3
MNLHVVFYQPEIPGNTGNMMRNSLASEAIFHIIKPISFDLDHPKMKRYAVNYERENIKLEVHESYHDFVQKYGKKRIFYISRYGLKTYSDVDFKSEAKVNDDEVWIMFGTESTGIPMKILKDNLETTLRIPMSPKARSLNLSNSATIVIWEILRQFNFENLSKYEVQKGKDWITEFDK